MSCGLHECKIAIGVKAEEEEGKRSMLVERTARTARTVADRRHHTSRKITTSAELDGNGPVGCVRLATKV